MGKVTIKPKAIPYKVQVEFNGEMIANLTVSDPVQTMLIITEMLWKRKSGEYRIHYLFKSNLQNLLSNDSSSQTVSEEDYRIYKSENTR